MAKFLVKVLALQVFEGESAEAVRATVQANIDNDYSNDHAAEVENHPLNEFIIQAVVELG